MHDRERDAGQGDRYRDAMPGVPWGRRRRALLRLFESIEPRYDRLNRWLSLGLDQVWRRRTASAVEDPSPGPWLDLASGTGDLAVFLRRRLDGGGLRRERGWLLRTDLSPALLRVGATKLRAPRRGAGVAAPAVACEMDRLPFRAGSFAVIAQGFALRHCRDLPGFFRELHRVVRPGGQILLLDMRYPARGPGTLLYRWYFRGILPRLAGWLGADRDAYRFMVDSVRALPAEEALLGGLRAAGFDAVTSGRGLLGAVHLLRARRAPGPGSC